MSIVCIYFLEENVCARLNWMTMVSCVYVCVGMYVCVCHIEYLLKILFAFTFITCARFNIKGNIWQTFTQRQLWQQIFIFLLENVLD